jgi:phage shock protein C
MMDGENKMYAVPENLLTRDDTFFGVCEGLGQDLRIPANFLRIGFAALLLASPLLAVKVYAGLGLVVLVSRLIYPAAPRRRARATKPVDAAVAPSVNQAKLMPELAQAA